MAEAAERTYELRSVDNKVVRVPECFMQMCITMKNMLEDMPSSPDDDPIPVHDVPSNILEKVAEYCIAHKDDKKEDNPAPKEYSEEEDFDAKFIRDMDQDTACRLLLAANFLDVKGLLILTSQHVASMLKNKTPEQIREHFDITGDFTEEEEMQIREENQWRPDDEQ